MKKTVLVFLFAFLLLTSEFWLLASSSLADVPKYISFQGELTDSAGARITTPVSATFKLYTVATAGSPIWTEAQPVSPDQGITNVSLGTVTPFKRGQGRTHEPRSPLTTFRVYAPARPVLPSQHPERCSTAKATASKNVRGDQNGRSEH